MILIGKSTFIIYCPSSVLIVNVFQNYVVNKLYKTVNSALKMIVAVLRFTHKNMRHLHLPNSF